MAYSTSVQIIAGIFMLSTASAAYVLNGYSGNLFQANDQQIVEPNTITTQSPQNNIIENQYCIQQAYRDFRQYPGDCNKFLMCSNNVLIMYSCPEDTVFESNAMICVPKGSMYDTCTVNMPVTEATPEPEAEAETSETTSSPEPSGTVACPRGTTNKKAHPEYCARYYDCGKPAMMDRWDDHEWECKYPFIFNEDTSRCEHYSMVDCGQRQIAYDKCDYKQFSCNGHAHCRPCSVSNPSCKGLKDGMNEWKGRSPSPYYVVCSQQRVVYSGQCSQSQIFDGVSGTCVADKQNVYY